MNLKSRNSHAFTLLELVVVLAILAVVTSLAVRALDGVEDQRRFESAQRALEEISAAVLGAPDDRAADGTRTVSGFVADMGRLPRATQEGNVFTLRELWERPTDSEFDIRQAKLENLAVSETSDEDEQVFVRGGWKGPYLRLPLGAETLLDAWGNPMISPVSTTPLNPDSTGYARLRNIGDEPITAAGEQIAVIQHLGANGRAEINGTGYDRDTKLDFRKELLADLYVQVEVLTSTNGDISPAIIDENDKIIVRVFGPSPINPKLIAVAKNEPKSFESNPVVCTISGIPIGPRAIRASFTDENPTTTSYNKSAVKHVTLRPGKNFVELTIDRRVEPPTP